MRDEQTNIIERYLKLSRKSRCRSLDVHLHCLTKEFAEVWKFYASSCVRDRGQLLKIEFGFLCRITCLGTTKFGEQCITTCVNMEMCFLFSCL